MQEINIFSLIKNSSIEIVVAAALSLIVTLLISSSHKLSSKKIFIISFTIGFAVCLVLSIFLTEFGLSDLLFKNCISSGTLSVTIVAFVKKFSITTSDDIKTSIKQLLSSIILSDKLDEVVEEIILKLNSTKEQEVTKSELHKILAQTTNIDEEKLDLVCDIIIKALEKHNTT